MILAHQDFEEPIVFKEGIANILVVEKQDLFLRYISDLSNQSNGDDGGFILSQNGNQIDISKVMDIVFSPLTIDVNTRISISSLHREISNRAFDENNYEKTNEMCHMVENVINELVMDSDIEVDYDELNIGQLLKSMNVKFHSSEDIVERLCDYISVKSIYEKKKIIVIVNACSYFSKDQLELIFNHIYNLKVYILLFEQHLVYRLHDVEIKTIDADLCEY